MQDEKQHRARGKEDRMVLAEHRTAPGDTHPNPGPGPPWTLEGNAQPIDRQQPEEEQGTVRQGERRCRQPVVSRQVERQGGKESCPGAIPPAGNPPHQPGGCGKQDDEPGPQRHRREGRAGDRQADHFDPGKHRRMVVIAQVGMDRIEEVIGLVVAQPQRAGGDPPHQGRDHDQEGEGTSGCHGASLLGQFRQSWAGGVKSHS